MEENQGKKRHILVDTQGFLMHALVRAADIQALELLVATPLPVGYRLVVQAGEGEEWRRLVGKTVLRVGNLAWKRVPTVLGAIS